MTGAPCTATFRGWLAAQTHRHDPVGDLARDAATDACWTSTGWQTFTNHLANHHDVERPVLDAARRARLEYRAWFHGVPHDRRRTTPPDPNGRYDR